ncbi:MAG: YitT family protein [Eubacterium sp.]|nr:YitT family protein [Eubacterium sp.]
MKEKNYKKQLMNILTVVAGNAILALGVVAFVVPAGIPMGGATGLGISGNHFFGIRTSLVVFVLNAILLIIGGYVLGRGFVEKTLLSTVIYPVFLELIQRIPGITTLTDNQLLSAIFGGLLIGLSMGSVVRAGGSTGGTDIIAMVANKKTAASVGTVVYIVDIIVLGIQATFSDMEQILYGIIIIILTTAVINKVVPNGKLSMQIMIISRDYEKIQHKILHEMEAGVTMFYIQTGYGNERQKGVMCVIPRHKLYTLKEMVYKTDPFAF